MGERRTHAGTAIIALLSPLTDTDLTSALAKKGITGFSMDALPRTTRAQTMDVLSS
ncbi:MAG: NAD(P)(+) transhydrogenase (Re/Si-specific) subunit alpha, partial [Chloroflexota bacterium]